MFKLVECLRSFERPYKLNQMNRFSTEYHLHEECVAAHSYYVSLFVLYLHNFYNFDLDKALKMAIIHDLPESFISDFPFHIKQENPQLQVSFDELDAKYSEYYNDNFFSLTTELMSEFNDKLTPEAKIANFADMLSSCLFCWTESELGNNLFAPKLNQKLQKCNEYTSLLKELEKDET